MCRRSIVNRSEQTSFRIKHEIYIKFTTELHQLQHSMETEHQAIYEQDKPIRLFYLDHTFRDDAHSHKTRCALQNLDIDTNFFSDSQTFLDEIASATSQHIILVTSGSQGEKILPSVHTLRQIDSIFIYCLKKKRYENLLKSYWKINGIFSTLEPLINAINNQIVDIKKHREIFRILKKEQKHTRYLPGTSSEFLKFRLFIHIIKQLPRDQTAKQDMFDLCRSYYHNQQQILHQIDLFERTYKSEDVIHWYTKQSFVFKLVNAALRTEHLDQLYAFRFFIGDLSDRLSQEHHKLIKSGERSLTVYRGTRISSNEADQLLDSIGKIIVFNSFISTSRERRISLPFAQKKTNEKNIVPVLFEITFEIHNTTHIVVLGDIASFSSYPPEKEVLFDLGTTFRIESCRQDGELLIVSLSVCPDGEALVQNYIDLLRQDTKENTPAIMLGSLLCNFGHYQKALQHFERLLSNTADEREKALIKMHIGRVLFHKEEYQEARRYFEQAKEFIEVANPPMEKELATVISLIGNDLQRLGDFQHALENYRYALKIRQRFYSSDGPNIAESYHDIGSVLDDMKRYTKSLDFYHRALEIWTECYPDGHPRRACTLNNMALVYKKEKNFEEALKYYEKAYEIYRNYYPDKHRDTGICMENIAAIYKSMGKYEKAIDAQREAVMIYEQFQSSTPETVNKARESLEQLENSFARDSQYF